MNPEYTHRKKALDIAATVAWISSAFKFTISRHQSFRPTKFFPIIDTAY